MSAPSSRSAAAGLSSSTCSTPSVNRTAIFLPSSLPIVGSFLEVVSTSSTASSFCKTGNPQARYKFRIRCRKDGGDEHDQQPERQDPARRRQRLHARRRQSAPLVRGGEDGRDARERR